jgi:hypothetical protein
VLNRDYTRVHFSGIAAEIQQATGTAIPSTPVSKTEDWNSYHIYKGLVRVKQSKRQFNERADVVR